MRSFLFIVMLLISGNIYAQKIAPRPMTGDVKEQKAANSRVAIGPKAGMNVARISSDDELSPDSRIGLRAGLFTEFQLSQSFYLQPEVLYASKGFQLDLPLLSSNLTASFHYLSVPVMLKYAIIDNASIQLLGLAAPYGAYMVSSESDVTSSNNPSPPGLDGSLTVEDWDVGAQGGLALAYKLDHGKLLLDVRLGFGFLDVSTPDDTTNLNQVLPSLSLGYAWQL